ncbi:MAG: ABC transporter permease [Clostridia bacterium]|nr:ABC transporter permease [Clostridia bacterium]
MKKNSLLSKLISAPHIVWAAIFIVVPLVMVVYYAFTDRNGDFTVENIKAMGYYTYVNVFLRSLWYGIIVTVICLVIAYPFAYVISNLAPKTQGTMVMLIMLPMWMSLLLRTYSIMALISDTGIINSFLEAVGIGRIKMINTPFAVILGMVYDFLPFMILPVYSAMTKMDVSLIETAYDLGANKRNVFLKVIIPLSRSGIVSGATMVFVPSVSTFFISQRLGGSKTALIGEIIESLFVKNNNPHLGSAISLVLMVLILICMFVMNRFGDEEEGAVMI